MKTAIIKPVFRENLEPLGEISIPVCSKITWDMLVTAVDSKHYTRLYAAVSALCGNIPENIPPATLRAILSDYIAFIDGYCKNNADIFVIPDKPDFESSEEEIKLPIVTLGESMVHAHTGLNFEQIGSLDILDYKMYLADAVKIRILSRCDGKGREYLNECYDYMHGNSSIFE